MRSILQLLLLATLSLWRSSLAKTDRLQDEEQSEAQIRPLHSNSSSGNPPMKRNSRLPPKLLTIEFQAFEYVFYIEIERQKRLISADSSIIIHSSKRSNADTAESSPNWQEIQGVPYSGRLVKIIPKPEAVVQWNLTEHTDRQPLARFHVEKLSDERLQITGGFMFNDTYFKVDQQQPNPFPLSNEAQNDGKMRAFAAGKRKPSVPPVLIISRDNGNDPVDKYKCGSSKHYEKLGELGDADLFQAALLANSTRKQYSIENSKMFASDGCPRSRKILYVNVVADCGYLEKMSGDLRAVQANIIADFNMVSAIYERSFNVELGILAIHIMEECTNDPWNRPCSKALSMDERLNAFSLWRGKQSQDAGLFHLVTGCLVNEVVGIAWLNQVCNVRSVAGRKGSSIQDANEGDIISGTSISALIRNQFTVIAHEIGHNFGAVHDCTSGLCANCTPGKQCSKCCECGSDCDCKGKFVMSPESGGMNVSGFSDCSRGDICRKMPILASCLKEPGTFRTIGKGVCGDGIRDEGEECDCGGEEGCRGNKCCTVNCKLKPGAACDDKSDRCCRECKIIGAAEKRQCSANVGFCTQPAICDGKNRDCPKPRQAPDGTKCPNGGKCASGLCTTRDEQCKAVGQRLGLTRACPATGSSCRMICAGEDSSRSALFSTCTIIDADFIDGTSCGFRGKCMKGKCSEGTIVGVLHEYWWLWAVVGGGVLIMAFLYAFRLTLAAVRRARHRPSIVLQ